MNASYSSLRRRIVRPVLWTAAFLVLPVTYGQFVAREKLAALFTDPPPAPAVPLPERPVHDPTRPTAVVVLGSGHTEATDFLAPFELLASSGAYNVYAVAGDRRPLPLFPGEIDVLPHYSLAEYDAQIGEVPALLVVPYMEEGDATADAELNEWIRRSWSAETLLVTICGGSYNAARAGLLAGRRATSHQNVLRLVREQHPEVAWMDGLRYVDDGNLVSSAGITSGVDAVLYVLARELGRDVAEEVARRVGYPYMRYLDDPTFTVPKASRFTMLLNGIFVPMKEMALFLQDGLSEIAIGALTDTLPRTFTVRPTTVALERRYVNTRHGLHLVPRWELDTAPPLGTLVLAEGAAGGEAVGLDAWAARRGVTVERLDPSSYAYDAALLDLSRRTGRAAATDAAKGLEYPVEHLGFATAAPPLGAAGIPLLLGLAGVVAGLGIRAGWRRARRGEAPPVGATSSRARER